MLYPPALSQPIPAWAANGQPYALAGPFLVETSQPEGSPVVALGAWLRQDDPAEDGVGWTWEDAERKHYLGLVDWSVSGDVLSGRCADGATVRFRPVTVDGLEARGVPVGDESPIVAAWRVLRPWWVEDEPAPAHPGYTPQPNSTMPRNWP